MDKYLSIFKDEEAISINFEVEHPKMMLIGEKMNQINEEAYMNGYNWEAFFNYYLEKNHSEIVKNMETDPEAGSLTIYYDLNSGNEERVTKLISIIENLIENEDQLYKIVKNEGSEIGWD